MSGIKTVAGISRRGFLKTGAVLAGGTWLGTTLGCTPSEGESTDNTDEVEEKVFNGCCRPNCFNLCKINVHVREGKIVKTAPSPYEGGEQYNRICLRGLSHVTRVYDPERIQYPLKRVGERGAGEWERISWDEAIDEIAGKFKQFQTEYGSSAVAYYTLSGNHGQLTSVGGSRFFNEIQATSLSCNGDMGNTVGLNRVLGFGGLWCGNETSDMMNAKNVFVWANNISDAQIHDWHFVMDAVEAGANLIVVDPTFTHTASKASKFVPLRPASDVALIMGMMNVIVEEDLIDRDFMSAYTCAPFLVNPETKQFSHLSALGGEVGESDPYLVWDEEVQALVAVEDAVKPSLEGEFDVNGVKCRTAYSLLRDEIAKYPVDHASEICDVPADTIVELARLACDGPVTHRIGWGANAYGNGVHQAHALATLGAITGQMCKPGANVGIVNWMTYSGWNSALAAASVPNPSPVIYFTEFPEVMRTGKWKGEDIAIKALYVYAANPVNTCTDMNAIIEAFGKIDFVVTADMFLSDTALYSDIVLPCADWFEYEDVVCRGTSYHMTFSDKAIDPLYESKPDFEIFRLLADKMGVGYFEQDNDAFLSDYVDTEASAAVGITFEELKEKGAIRPFAEPFLRWNDHKFLTSSGRMEFYVENPAPMFDLGRELDLDRERLPHFFQPIEAWSETVGGFEMSPRAEKYPFVLNSERPRYRVHSQWSSNKYLRELDPEPTVKINPVDAQAKGIADGDYVECFNDRGHAVAKAVCNDAVRPGVLVYPKSWQAYQHKAGAWSELTTCEVDDFGANMNWMDVLCDVRVWEGAE